LPAGMAEVWEGNLKWHQNREHRRTEFAAAFHLQRSKNRWRRGRKRTFHSHRKPLHRRPRAGHFDEKPDRWPRLFANRDSQAQVKRNRSARSPCLHIEWRPKRHGLEARVKPPLENISGCRPVVSVERDSTSGPASRGQDLQFASPGRMAVFVP